MIVFILFSVFFIIKERHILINKNVLLFGIFIAIINVFMSISRSAFLLSITGIVIVLLFQGKLNAIKPQRIFYQISAVVILTLCTVIIVNNTGLNFVFRRMVEMKQENKESGGLTIERILNGSAFNRETAFNLSFQRYESKESWLIGYGWGIGTNKRDAYFVDPTILRTSSHSQIFATLFLFGWLGFLAYWVILLRIIYKSFKIIGNKNVDYYIRIFAFFFSVSLSLFVLNEIKVDSIDYPTYFGVTIVWMGLAYSTINSKFRNEKPSTILLNH
jgi:hypothetical protein